MSVWVCWSTSMGVCVCVRMSVSVCLCVWVDELCSENMISSAERERRIEREILCM